MRILRSIVTTLAAVSAGLGGACSGDSEKGAAVHSLDLTRYDPGETPPSLRIANETLILPLRPGAPSRTLSRAEPGDLQIIYTRVGCWISEPQSTLTRADISVPSQPPVDLLGVSIEQELGAMSSITLQELGQQTCLTYRTAAGSWKPLIAPTSIATRTNEVRTEFTPPTVEADAFAIFFPLYSNVKRITYTVVEPVR